MRWLCINVVARTDPRSRTTLLEICLQFLALVILVLRIVVHAVKVFVPCLVGNHPNKQGSNQTKCIWGLLHLCCASYKSLRHERIQQTLASLRCNKGRNTSAGSSLKSFSLNRRVPFRKELGEHHFELKHWIQNHATIIVRERIQAGSSDSKLGGGEPLKDGLYGRRHQRWIKRG